MSLRTKKSTANKNKSKLSSFCVTKRALAVSIAAITISTSSLLTADELKSLDETQINSSKKQKVISALNNRFANRADIREILASKFRKAVAGRRIKDQYIVVLKDDYVEKEMHQMAAKSGISASSISAADFKQQAVTSMVDNMASAYGMEVRQRYYSALSGFVMRGDRRTMKDMMTDDRIAFIEEDQIMRRTETQFNATWGLDRVDQEDLPLDSQYTFNFDGTGVSAYVIDTGILDTHSNFDGRVQPGFTAFNDGRGSSDCNGHGTHVAGTLGSRTYGVAKNVDLYPVRVLGCTGSGSNSGVIAGVDWVAENATLPAVANMSLGGGRSRALDNAVNRAIDQGITFVVAAGNDNSDACGFSPARVPDALTIGSSTRTDARSGFSNFGSCVDMFAPGSGITSTWSNGRTNTISGTSMASPHVAGVAALYLQANPSATPQEVEEALENTAARDKIRNPQNSPNLLVQTTFDAGDSDDGEPTGPTPIDVSRSGLEVDRNRLLRFVLDLEEEGYSNLTVTLDGGTGDADLFMNFGSAPSRGNIDCQSTGRGNDESCTFQNPQSGRWFITIRGTSSSEGFNIRATAE